MFNMMMKTSGMPIRYRVVAERSDAPSILSRFTVYYLTVLTIPALAVALLAKDLIDILGDPRYAGAYAYVPAFVVLYYIQAIAAAMGRGMDLAKKTALWPLVAVVSVVTAAAALAVLVPMWGAVGAVVALIIATAVRVVTQVALSVHYYPRPLRLGLLAQVWAIALAAFWLGRAVEWPGLWTSIAGKTAIVALAAVVALSLLVPAWGAAGAVAALVIAAAIRVITQVALSVHYYPRPLRLGSLAAVWAIALAAFWLGYAVQWPGLWTSIAGKIAIVAIAALALARAGFGAEALKAVLARVSSARAKQG
jgi:hypothetical protein